MNLGMEVLVWSWLTESFPWSPCMRVSDTKLRSIKGQQENYSCRWSHSWASVRTVVWTIWRKECMIVAFYFGSVAMGWKAVLMSGLPWVSQFWHLTHCWYLSHEQCLFSCYRWQKEIRRGKITCSSSQNCRAGLWFLAATHLTQQVVESPEDESDKDF